MRRMRWAGHIARVRYMRNTYSILVANPEARRFLRGSRCRCEDNVKMDLQDIGLGVRTEVV